MDMETIIQLINGVGFPIAVSVALFWTNTRQDERYSNTMKDLTQVIENNTRTLAELSANCNIKNEKGCTNGKD